MSTPTTATTSEAYTAEEARAFADAGWSRVIALVSDRGPEDGQSRHAAMKQLADSLRLYADMREAMEEIANACRCTCGEEWTDRGLHARQCRSEDRSAILGIARRFVTPTEEKRS